MKFKAFLSYSHRDTVWAVRLHLRLERFRIDNDLVGRETPVGPIPRSLRPIFRDREDFSAGQSLDDQTRAALESSPFLIVLCSPDSARSAYVNQEVLEFKKLGRGDAIIPVIVEGAPGGKDNECFPPALRYHVNAKGEVTNEKAEMLAADVRESGDGLKLATAKIAARLLGLGTDEVWRRAERERRRVNRNRLSILAVIGFLTLGGSLMAYQAYVQRKTLSDIEALVAQYSIVSPAQGAVPSGKDGLTDAITAIVNGAARDQRYSRALQQLKDGKTDEAEKLLRQVAEETAARAQVQGKQAAEAYRRLGAIAGLGDPKRAREAYAKALEFDRGDPVALYWYGWLNLLAGDLTAAEEALNSLMAVSEQSKDDLGIYRAHLRLGEVVYEKGHLDAALTHQRKAMEIARRRASEEPENEDRQRDLSVSHEKIGDILVAQGQLGDALKYYRDSLAIAAALAKSDPQNARWQRDLSVSHERVGDALMIMDDLDEALRSFRESVEIRKQLVAKAPDNAGWQRDLSVSHERVGDVLMYQGKPEEALKSYQDSLAISERLASADKNNAGWQHDLSVSQTKVGDVLTALEKPDEALTYYQDSLTIARNLADSDTSNAGWQRDLSVSHNKVGDSLLAKGDLKGAMTSFLDTLKIRESLVKTDPSNAVWQRDLAVSYSKIANVHELSDEPQEALKALRQGRAIMARLIDLSIENKAWKGDLVWFEEQISKLKK